MLNNIQNSGGLTVLADATPAQAAAIMQGWLTNTMSQDAGPDKNSDSLFQSIADISKLQAWSSDLDYLYKPMEISVNNVQGLGTDFDGDEPPLPLECDPSMR